MNKIITTITLFISIVFFLFWGVFRFYNNYIISKDCIGYLKQAADANTVSLAKERLIKAINYIEIRGLTNGSTAIILYTPSKDLGFWYRNLKASLVELDTVTEKSTSLEKSNMLIKLRETLVDHDSNGVSVTCPPGISIFPYNTLYALIGGISFIMIMLSFLWSLVTKY